MSLAFMFGEEEHQFNEHELAWKNKDWDSVKKLADSFKQDANSEFFDILNRINLNKVRLNADACENYSQYAINHVMSGHTDCVYHAYVLNLLGDAISDQMHFDYLCESVIPRKRYGGTKAVSDAIEVMSDKTFIRCVGKYYEVSDQRATEYVKMFTEDQLAHMKKILRATATESMILEANPQAKKGDIAKVVRVIEDWNK
ncbi:MAG: DNA polymerase clamp loader subunit A [Cetobacterium sp.]|uniref:DNA polymerase clamp loader subunit A n=1 Tax=Cetobacterium sp. TaxID=2071632 RepID=UPI003EE5AAF8